MVTACCKKNAWPHAPHIPNKKNKIKILGPYSLARRGWSSKKEKNDTWPDIFFYLLSGGRVLHGPNVQR